MPWFSPSSCFSGNSSPPTTTQAALMTPSQVDRPTRSPDPALPPRTSEKTIKRLPKASRECVGRKLAAILGAVIDKNDHTSWMRLLCFSARCLRCPAREGCRMSAKLEEGDFKGAVRLASSDDTLAPMNEATLEALKGKHPAPHPDSTIPSAEETSQHLPISEEEVAQAIHSFQRAQLEVLMGSDLNI